MSELRSTGTEGWIRIRYKFIWVWLFSYHPHIVVLRSYHTNSIPPIMQKTVVKTKKMLKNTREFSYSFLFLSSSRCFHDLSSTRSSSNVESSRTSCQVSTAKRGGGKRPYAQSCSICSLYVIRWQLWHDHSVRPPFWCKRSFGPTSALYILRKTSSPILQRLRGINYPVIPDNSPAKILAETSHFHASSR